MNDLVKCRNADQEGNGAFVLMFAVLIFPSLCINVIVYLL